MQIFKILQVANFQYCKVLKCYYRVLFQKIFPNLAEINQIIKNWNAPEPIDVAVFSMSWVSFIWQVKLNILSRIVIPDKVVLGSPAVICY